MALAHPTARDVLLSAWNAAGLVLRLAGGTVLIAWSIYLAVDLCKFELASDPVIARALRILLDAMSTILLVPFQIAVYRLIILGERPSRYLAYFSGRFRPYFAWTMIWWCPSLIGEFLPHDSSILFAWSTTLTIIGVVAAVRVAVLFPALAAGRHDVTLRDAWQDTQGRVWTIIRIWLPMIAVLFGIVMASIVITNFVGSTDSANGLPFWRIAVHYALTNASVLLASVAVMVNMALIYDVVGDRVKPAA